MESQLARESRLWYVRRTKQCPRCKIVREISSKAVPDHKWYDGRACVNMKLVTAKATYPDGTRAYTLTWKCNDCSFKLVETEVSTENIKIACEVTSYTQTDFAKETR